MSALFIHSHFGNPPAPFRLMAQEGRVTILRDWAVNSELIAEADGIITTMHLDQVQFAGFRPALERFFGRGGRLFFNGHILRPFVEGLEIYRPLLSKRLADMRLVRLERHPVFGALDPADMMTRNGVAGFYGRGHNPMPKGARALTGLGPLKQPIDWEWKRPGGGTLLVHAGNDLWGMAPGGAVDVQRFAERILRWANGELVEVEA